MVRSRNSDTSNIYEILDDDEDDSGSETTETPHIPENKIPDAKVESTRHIMLLQRYFPSTCLPQDPTLPLFRHALSVRWSNPASLVDQIIVVWPDVLGSDVCKTDPKMFDFTCDSDCPPSALGSTDEIPLEQAPRWWGGARFGKVIAVEKRVGKYFVILCCWLILCSQLSDSPHRRRGHS